MKLLALLGSLILLIYIVGLVMLTAINISRTLFSLDPGPRHGFFARQALIIFWLLVVISAEGRETLRAIWFWQGEEECE